MIEIFGANNFKVNFLRKSILNKNSILQGFIRKLYTKMLITQNSIKSFMYIKISCAIFSTSGSEI